MTSDLIVKCSINAGRNSLSIKVLRSHNAYVCERRQVERDGTESIQSFPFSTLETLQTFIKSDSYYQTYAGNLDMITSAMGKYING